MAQLILDGAPRINLSAFDPGRLEALSPRLSGRQEHYQVAAPNED
jgi:hypothetical protein